MLSRDEILSALTALGEDPNVARVEQVRARFNAASTLPWGASDAVVHAAVDAVRKELDAEAQGRTPQGEPLDHESRELGELALRNQFYDEYRTLVARYLYAADGLGLDDLRGRLVEMSNPYACDLVLDRPVEIEVITGGKAERFLTIAEALSARGDELRIEGKAEFTWREPLGWYVAEAPSAAPSPD
jgi:hypothetical protein